MSILAILSIILKTIQLMAQLFWIWFTLNWKVRTARKAFEKELVQQGLSKEDARQLSKQIKIAKDKMMSSLWTLAAQARHTRPANLKPE